MVLHKHQMRCVFRCVAISALIGLLAACQTTTTKVMLLPQAGKPASKVVVKLATYERVLDKPYLQGIWIAQEPRIREILTAEQAYKEYPALFDSAPALPNKYVLYFLPGGFHLKPESQVLVTAILDDAFKRTGADIVVTGHTDTKGALLANDELSLKRAKAIVQILVDKGVAHSRVEAVGRGKRELLVPTADGVDEPKNRRVEIIVR